METPGEYTETLGLRSFTLRNFIEDRTGAWTYPSTFPNCEALRFATSLRTRGGCCYTPPNCEALRFATSLRKWKTPDPIKEKTLRSFTLRNFIEEYKPCLPPPAGTDCEALRFATSLRS